MNETPDYSLAWFLHAIGRVIAVLTPIAWPVVAMATVLLFRKQIVGLLGRVRGAKGFGVEVVTGDTDETRGLAAEFISNLRDFLPSGSVTAGQKFKPGATIHFGPKLAANYYFFSHDLMLCYTALITGADTEVIVHTLRSAIAHIEKFAPMTPHHQSLVRLLELAEKCSDADWTEKRRRQDARKIWLISRTLGDIIVRISRELPDENESDTKGPTSRQSQRPQPSRGVLPG